MLIRPYTISGVAIVLLQLYAAGYILRLASTSPNINSSPRQTDRQLAILLLLWAVLAFHVNLLAIGTSSFIANTQYLRAFQGLLLLGVAVHLIYTLTATVTDAYKREHRVTAAIFLLLVIIESTFTLWRYQRGLTTGAFPIRPFLFKLPLILIQFWLITLLWRVGLFVERRPTDTLATRVVQFHIAPHTRLGRFLRDASSVALGSLIIFTIFVLVQVGDTVLWNTNISDLISVFMTLMLVFGYLKLVQEDVGIELRVIGVGLALFLTFSSTLGWLIASAYLEQQLPSVPLNSIVGTNNNPFNELNPDYLPVVRDLHQLLVPLVWFQLIGSVGCILVFRLYFRRTFSAAISAVVGGIDQIEQGNLTHSIDAEWQGEFGRIARAFNQMSHSLYTSNEELSRYQTSLTQMVETRTEQLSVEITQRKNAELRESIQAERSRIARDAHDGILQHFLALRMRLRSRRLRQLNSAELGHELDGIASDILSGAQELRELIHSLETAWLHMPLEQSLAEIATRFRKSSEISLEVNLAPNLPALKDEKRLTLLRILQEALSNVVRHSHATSCVVTLSQHSAEPDTILLSVQDDGIGISPSQLSEKRGNGLSNMHYRASTHGGSAKIQPAQNGCPGTVIKVQLPI